MIPVAGAEGQNRTDDTRLFRAVLYRLSYLGSGPASGGRKDTDGIRPSQLPTDFGQPGGCTSPIWPAMFSSARIRSPIGGWVSHSDFARSSNDLIGLTM